MAWIGLRCLNNIRSKDIFQRTVDGRKNQIWGFQAPHFFTVQRFQISTFFTSPKLRNSRKTHADALGSLAKGRRWTLGLLKPTKDDATQIFIHWNLWKHGNPVSWTSQAGSFALICCIRWFCLSMTHSPLWIQPSTANCLWSYRNPHASF